MRGSCEHILQPEMHIATRSGQILKPTRIFLSIIFAAVWASLAIIVQATLVVFRICVIASTSAQQHTHMYLAEIACMPESIAGQPSSGPYWPESPPRQALPGFRRKPKKPPRPRKFWMFAVALALIFVGASWAELKGTILLTQGDARSLLKPKSLGVGVADLFLVTCFRANFSPFNNNASSRFTPLLQLKMNCCELLPCSVLIWVPYRHMFWSSMHVKCTDLFLIFDLHMCVMQISAVATKLPSGSHICEPGPSLSQDPNFRGASGEGATEYVWPGAAGAPQALLQVAPASESVTAGTVNTYSTPQRRAAIADAQVGDPLGDWA